jgi:hypothetical protein
VKRPGFKQTLERPDFDGGALLDSGRRDWLISRFELDRRKQTKCPATPRAIVKDQAPELTRMVGFEVEGDQGGDQVERGAGARASHLEFLNTLRIAAR